MGGFMGSRSPAPLPTPARPVTAVTKTPDIELDDTELESEQISKKRKGKRALRQDITKDTATQVASEGSGLQIPKGS
jgi:hypothetical protein